MPKQKKVCELCESTSLVRYNNIFDMDLCKECKEDPEHKMIYKSTAKNLYRLTEKEVHDLERFDGISPYGAATLLREQDVKNYFCVKHQISEDEIESKLNELDMKRIVRAKKILKAKENAKLVRRKELKKALHTKGLELRADSKLCAGYIDGSILDKDIDDIVERMAQMKYLFDYANMNHYIKKAERDQCKELNAGYLPDMSVFEQAEWYALKKIGDWPDKWPWLD